MLEKIQSRLQELETLTKLNDQRVVDMHKARAKYHSDIGMVFQKLAKAEEEAAKDRVRVKNLTCFVENFVANFRASCGKPLVLRCACACACACAIIGASLCIRPADLLLFLVRNGDRQSGQETDEESLLPKRL